MIINKHGLEIEVMEKELIEDGKELVEVMKKFCEWLEKKAKEGE